MLWLKLDNCSASCSGMDFHQHQQSPNININTVDGRNPANQLRLAVYPFIPLFAGFYTSQVVVWDFFHQQYHHHHLHHHPNIHRNLRSPVSPMPRFPPRKIAGLNKGLLTHHDPPKNPLSFEGFPPAWIALPGARPPPTRKSSRKRGPSRERSFRQTDVVVVVRLVFFLLRQFFTPKNLKNSKLIFRMICVLFFFQKKIDQKLPKTDLLRTKCWFSSKNRSLDIQSYHLRCSNWYVFRVQSYLLSFGV